MKNPTACIFFFVLFSLCLLQTPASSALFGPEPDDQSDFNYVEGSGKGPDDWWRLKGSWGTCKHGKLQSPINLKDENAFPDPSLRPLEADYKRRHAIMRNRGHDIMLGWPDGGGTLQIGDTEYRLQQCHWHSPAEHAINGVRPDLEMQMVHQNDEKVAVVGILYNLNNSAPDPFLSKLEEPLKRLAKGEEDQVRVGRVAPWEVEGPPYYRYVGSTTVPPCKKGVVWTVLKEVQSVSQDQVQLLRDAVHDGMQNNARPLQPTNGRLIDLFQPPVQDEHPSS